ncbi:TolC family protein [Dyadobacter bucti]|uniref:TolC family protein n=1 Tax=Dyadobacter bucti TaxID=2572203 RepID=UPI00140B7C2B|nr:TolC family protein [Dyadobacter bucti]
MKILAYLLLAACFFSAKAQDIFSLGQSVDYTLQHHPSLLVYDNNSRIAREKSTQSLSGYLPQVTASATLIDNIRLQTTVLPAGIFGPEPKAVQLGTKYNTNAGLDFSQTIYDQSKLTGIKANKPYMIMTELQKKQNQELLIYNTSTAYFQVLIYQQQLAILRSNKVKYEEMVKVLTYQYEKGMVLEKDVDRIKVNLNTTNYQIDDAAIKEQLAINTLKNAMGMPLENELVIRDSLHYEMFADGLPKESLSLESLTEVKINEQSIALQEINVKIKQAAYLPTLNAVGKLATQSLSNDFSDAFASWKGFTYVGATLSIPLTNGFKRKSMLKEEKLILDNNRSEFNINKENLKLRFENAKTAVGTAYSSYRSSEDNMVLAKKLLDVTDYQYQRGVVGLTDYLNDDSAYKTAQANYINGLYNLMISQLNYQKSQGTLPDFINKLR